MKIKRKRILAVLIIAMLSLGFLAGCAADDTALVTLKISRAGQISFQNDSLLDRVIAFIFCGRDLHASYGSPFSQSWDKLTLKVEGEGMETIETQIPPTQNEITVSIPAGVDRVFTVIGYNNNFKRWGSLEKSNLTAGKSIELEMLMLPMSNNITSMVLTVGEIRLYWDYMDPMPSIVTGAYVYQSFSQDGEYVLIKTITPASTHETIITGMTYNKRYYFKVKYFSNSKEGPFSDIYSVLGP